MKRVILLVGSLSLVVLAVQLTSTEKVSYFINSLIISTAKQDTISQATPDSQLSDVQPTDWAFLVVHFLIS